MPLSTRTGLRYGRQPPLACRTTLWGKGRALEYVMIFWGLGLGAIIVGELESMSKARAFFGLLCSASVLMLLVFSLYLGGLVSKEILTAMFPV